MSFKIDHSIDIRIYESRKAMGAAAAERFAGEVIELLTKNEEINIVFAAAPSQNEFLENLSHYPIEWNKINAFHMDEYIGLDTDAPQGFGNFLKERLFGKYSFKSVNYLNGNATDLEMECLRYGQLLKKHPIDIVCMGIGENGHLAFNDPPVADFNDKKTVKVVELDHTCRIQQVNDGCFKMLDDVPRFALTLTIPALMDTSFISCVVPGPTKALAVKNTFENTLSTKYPSTILTQHPNVILYLDVESAQLLNKDIRINN